MSTITTRPGAQAERGSRGNSPVRGGPPPGRVPYRLSVEQYEAMVASGAFRKEDRLELIEGSLVEKMTRDRITRRDLRIAGARCTACFPPVGTSGSRSPFASPTAIASPSQTFR